MSNGHSLPISGKTNIPYKVRWSLRCIFNTLAGWSFVSVFSSFPAIGGASVRLRPFGPPLFQSGCVSVHRIALLLWAGRTFLGSTTGPLFPPTNGQIERPSHFSGLDGARAVTSTARTSGARKARSVVKSFIEQQASRFLSN